MAFIYGLTDPVSGQLRYVGYTAGSVEDRAGGHWRSRRAHNHKNHWIRWLWDTHQKKPEWFVIEEIHENDWLEAETFWISYFRAIGADLTNNSLGGEGRVKGTKLSPEHRAKISEGLKRAVAEGRFDQAAAGAKRRGRPAWNSGKTMPNTAPKTGKTARGVKRPWLNGEENSKHRRKQVVVRSPLGERVEIDGINKFCRDNGLKAGNFSSMTRGVLKTSQGWSLWGGP